MEHTPEVELNRGAQSGIVGDLDGDLATINGLYGEPGETGAAPVDLHPYALAAQGFSERGDEGVHLGGNRGEQVEVLGGANHQVVGQHRVATGDGDVKRLGQVEHDPGYPLVQRVQAHLATAPSNGRQAARTCGDSHSRAHRLTKVSASMNRQTSDNRPSLSTIW